MYKTLLICLSIAVSVTSLHARSVRALFLSPPKNAPKSVFLYSGGKSLELPLPTRNLSQPVQLPKGALSLAVLSNALKGDAKVPKGAQIIKIPEQWKNCIMVFTPDPKNKVFPAKVMVIDSSNAKFPKGNTMVHNLTNSLFMGKFGDKMLSVKPWKSKKVKTAAKDGTRFYPVAIDCIAADTKTRSAITRTNWIHYPDARQILFVTQAPGQKVPRVWGVLDRTLEKKDQ